MPNRREHNKFASYFYPEPLNVEINSEKEFKKISDLINEYKDASAQSLGPAHQKRNHILTPADARENSKSSYSFRLLDFAHSFLDSIIKNRYMPRCPNVILMNIDEIKIFNEFAFKNALQTWNACHPKERHRLDKSVRELRVEIKEIIGGRKNARKHQCFVGKGFDRRICVRPYYYSNKEFDKKEYTEWISECIGYIAQYNRVSKLKTHDAVSLYSELFGKLRTSQYILEDYLDWHSPTYTTILPTYWPATLDMFRNYGAMEIRSLEVAKQFADLDYDVNILAPKGSHIPYKNIKVHSGDYGPWGGAGVHPYNLEKNLVESNLDILKNSDAVSDDTHFRFWSYLKSKSPKEYPHTAFSMDFHPDQLSSLPMYPQNMITVSKWTLSTLREKFKNQGHKFWHAYSGLIINNYPSEFDPSLIEDNLYLFLCRFSKVKSPHLVLELAKENLDDKFVMLGDLAFANEPHYGMAIKNVADRMPNVKVIFNASYEEKIEYLQRCVGLLHPGFWQEPFGFDFVEGLYFGSKLLSFDRGAAREIYRNKEQGIIAPFTNNEAQNIDIYKRAFRIFKKLKVKPEDCRQRVLENFDFSVHSFPKYLDVLFPKK